MAAFTTMLAVGSIGLGAASAYKSSKANKAQAKSQAAQAQANAKIARRNAADVVERGKDALYDQKQATIKSLSSVRSGVAGAGFAVDSAGSTGQELVKAMSEAGEIDISRLKENIDREEQRALDQGMNYSMQADQFKTQARGYNPLLSGITAGVGSAVRGADILF